MKKFRLRSRFYRMGGLGSSVALATLLVAPSGVSAQTAPYSVGIQPVTSSVAIGSEVTVDVVASTPTSSQGIGSWTVEIPYKPALVGSGTSITCTTEVGDSFCNTAYQNQPVIKISGADNTGISGTSVPLASITFQGVAAGVQPLDPQVAVTDTSGTTLSPSIVYGTLTVGSTSAQAPTITSVSPNQGSATGGTTVTITGTNLAGASAVDFGSTPATTFSVVSSTEIDAVSPVGTAGTTTDITVIGPSGASAISSADQFTYPGTASGGPQVNLTPSTASVAPGGTTTLTLQAIIPSGGAGLGDWAVEVQYNPNKVTPVSNNPDLSLVNPKYGNGLVMVTGVDSNITSGGLTGTINLADLAFQAFSNDSAGTTANLNVKVITFADGTGAPLNATPGNASLQIGTGTASTGTASSGTPVGGGGGGGGGGFFTPSPSTLVASSHSGTNSVTSAGGLLTTADGQFSMQVAAGALTAPASLSVSDSSTDSCALPADLQAISPFVTLTGGTLNPHQTATLRYSQSALQGYSAHRVALYANTGSCKWTYVPSTLSSTTSSLQGYVKGPETLVAVVNTQRFSDVASGYWAGPYIDQMAADGIINGFPHGTFAPAANLTRAQFVKMVDTALGVTIPTSGATPFTDVPVGEWYAPYVAATVHAGWIQGTSADTFSPNAPITREEVATIISRAFRLPTSQTPLSFADDSMISSWALQGVQNAVASGVLQGMPGNVFQPEAYTTRAQAAAVLTRIIALLAPPQVGSGS